MDALLQHIANLGGLLGEIVGVSDPFIELYGDPSAELLEATAAFNSPVYSFFKGA